MLDLISKLENFYPFVALLAGLGGSLHCMGMCGGLVTATCSDKKDILNYQLGRLLSYIILGGIGGLIGSFISLRDISPELALLTGFTLGGMFIFWGVQSYKGKKAELPMPKSFGILYANLFKKIFNKKHPFSKSFLTGLLSMLLPCGFLYGIIIGAIALENPFIGALTMLAFWLGTLPSMILVPGVFQRILKPFNTKLPKTYALSLVMIGILTIGFRVNHFYDMNHAIKHDPHQAAPSCH